MVFLDRLLAPDPSGSGDSGSLQPAPNRGGGRDAAGTSASTTGDSGIGTKWAATDRGTREPLSHHEFAEAFAASGRPLWCIAAATVGDRTQADDVLQESAMIALSKLDDFTRGTSFLAWMSSIVRFVALNHRRRLQRHDAAPLAGADVKSQPSVEVMPITSHGHVARDQGSFDDAVLHALGRLEPVARACLLLRAVNELPYREIALALDIPEGTAMSHVHRARHAMRSAMAGRFEESERVERTARDQSPMKRKGAASEGAGESRD